VEGFDDEEGVKEGERSGLVVRVGTGPTEASIVDGGSREESGGRGIPEDDEDEVARGEARLSAAKAASSRGVCPTGQLIIDAPRSSS
jgi:hypothetical protein